ncbi:MAG TPA: TPM domain-containing protein, partial [Dokdonella sp.]|nr:TPM domain-containing protein [Dokdonella sp.]
MRVIRHLFVSSRRRFPPARLDTIQHAISASEHRHRGEIVFAVEGSLPLADVVRGRSARDRAHEVFARLRVWNTEHNTGVLIYLLLADHAIEIVADRGVAKEIPEREWTPICALMEDYFRKGEYEHGALEGVAVALDELAGQEHDAARGIGGEVLVARVEQLGELARER